MRTIIAGSREGFSLADVHRAIEKSGFQDEITEVVSGGARGVDRLGEGWGKARGLPVRQFIPDWEKHKKGAAHVRNQEMADYASALILVWDGVSTGSADMLQRAQKAGLRVYVHKNELKGYRRDR